MPATIVLTGRLARDPETRTTASGTTICNLTVPVDSGYGDNKTTTWWKVAVFGKRAETAARYLRKGSWVSVTGNPRVATWDKNDGTKGFSAEVNADSWDFVGAKQDGGQNQGQGYGGQGRGQGQGQGNRGGGGFPTDDIPF